MLRYGVHARNRFRRLFDDFRAIKCAGGVAVDLELKPVDAAARDFLEHVQRWNAIGRAGKAPIESALHLSNDHAWIEPGGDVHCYQTATGGSRKPGTVDDPMRRFLVDHQVKVDAGAPRPEAGAAGRFN